jgi:hypothetical protein
MYALNMPSLMCTFVTCTILPLSQPREWSWADAVTLPKATKMTIPNVVTNLFFMSLLRVIDYLLSGAVTTNECFKHISPQRVYETLGGGVALTVISNYRKLERA